jgi:hypothetical protein
VRGTVFTESPSRPDDVASAAIDPIVARQAPATASKLHDKEGSFGYEGRGTRYVRGHYAYAGRPEHAESLHGALPRASNNLDLSISTLAPLYRPRPCHSTARTWSYLCCKGGVGPGDARGNYAGPSPCTCAAFVRAFSWSNPLVRARRLGVGHFPRHCARGIVGQVHGGHFCGGTRRPTVPPPSWMIPRSLASPHARRRRLTSACSSVPIPVPRGGTAQAP